MSSWKARDPLQEERAPARTTPIPPDENAELAKRFTTDPAAVDPNQNPGVPNPNAHPNMPDINADPNVPVPILDFDNQMPRPVGNAHNADTRPVDLGMPVKSPPKRGKA